jgi:hypothetical protein
MELIESFIAILEAAAERQASQENSNSTVAAHQPTKSQEAAAFEGLLFNSSVREVPSRSVAECGDESTVRI